jgi:hypothetical protein
MTVYLVIYLPKIHYIHRVNMVLAKSKCVPCWQASNFVLQKVRAHCVLPVQLSHQTCTLCAARAATAPNMHTVCCPCSYRTKHAHCVLPMQLLHQTCTPCAARAASAPNMHTVCCPCSYRTKHAHCVLPVQLQHLPVSVARSVTPKLSNWVWREVAMAVQFVMTRYLQGYTCVHVCVCVCMRVCFGGGGARKQVYLRGKEGHTHLFCV